MSYGIQGWGVSSWGGADFIVTNHVPIDNATGVSRLPTIAFTLQSQSGPINLSSINLTVNGIQLIINGSFTIDASGTIDSTNPSSVNIIATVTHAFPPFTIVTVTVSALNSSNQAPTLGSTWLFAVNNILTLFSHYIVRRFEKVLRIGVSGLDAPQNPMAVVELAPPPNLMAEVI